MQAMQLLLAFGTAFASSARGNGGEKGAHILLFLMTVANNAYSSRLKS